MSKQKRGGQTLDTGKIGRVNCLRQQILMPGEKMNTRLKGSVRLETLRERDVLRINAHLATFMTPLRWLWPEYPDYVREGPDTAIVPPTTTDENWAKYGVGSYAASGAGNLYTWWRDAPLRIYNEYYKWPEAADITAWPNDGGKAVPLAKPWSRARVSAGPSDSDDYNVDVSGSTMDIRTLAEIQAKFRGAQKRETLSFGRWMETVQNVWKGTGSREVDKVPMLIDEQQIGVNPREMPATDGASLGTWQSMYDFQVDNTVKGIIAPEHCVLSYMLTVRFSSITESCHPLATNKLDWHELVGDPEYLAAAQPVEIQKGDFYQSSSTESFGYLPAGWQWRTDHDVIGKRIDERDSFPMMEIPGNADETKDATRVVPAFRSKALGDYLVDVYFTEDSYQPIGDSMDSYMSGMADDANPRTGGGGEFPFTGKVK